MEPSPEQLTEARRIKSYFPFRRIYLITESNKWEVVAPKDRRMITSAISKGAQVHEFKFT